MLSRIGRIALLCFQAIWFNAIVPGHARGMVGLPGTSCGACCEVSHSDHAPASKPTPASDPVQSCSICYFAACIFSPPIVDFTPPRLRFLQRLAPPVAFCPISIALIATYNGRAPPSMA